MPSDTLLELIELAGTLRPAHEELLERVRAFGRALGIEVLDLRPAALGGAWEVCVRPLPVPGSAPGDPAPSSPGEPEPVRAGRSIRPPPFLSPVRESAPFDGDGTDDILRFIAEADPGTRVPARGGPAPGAVVRVLSAGERAGMLAGTIAGDALLSLQHRGLSRDPAEVDGVLVHAREQYLTEVGRCGVEVPPADLSTDFDRAAADLCHTLLNASC